MIATPGSEGRPENLGNRPETARRGANTNYLGRSGESSKVHPSELMQAEEQHLRDISQCVCR